jgi:hypothetical protein
MNIFADWLALKSARLNLPDGHPRRKAVLKTRAVQTLRDCRTPSNCAKRLECGAFTAAFLGEDTRRRIVRRLLEISRDWI